VRRTVAALVVALAAAVAASCGGGGGGQATLWVTRDEGRHVVLTATVPAGLTALQALRRKADVTTRYGGRFVQSIEGIKGSLDDRRDWFWFVNGLEGDRSAAEYRLHDGDVEWWDYRSWANGRDHVPVVVGAFPEPFLHGYGGRRLPTDVRWTRRADRAAARKIARLVHARSVGGPDDAVGPNANVIVIYPEIPDLAGILQQDPGPHEPVELDLGPATAARLARDPRALRFRYGDAP